MVHTTRNSRENVKSRRFILARDAFRRIAGWFRRILLEPKCMHACMHACVCTHTHTHTHTVSAPKRKARVNLNQCFLTAPVTHGAALIGRERREAANRVRVEHAGQGNAVSFHNFKSQNFKLSVSNPKSKYVAYLSVLSQISNCQGLGRKNKH